MTTVDIFSLKYWKDETATKILITALVIAFSFWIYFAALIILHQHGYFCERTIQQGTTLIINAWCGN